MNIQESVKQKLQDQDLISFTVVDRAMRADARRKVGAKAFQVVHHIDGDRWNNDLGNLRIVEVGR